MTEERCNLTDLLTRECGCKNCRNSPEVGEIDRSEYMIERWFSAKYDGRCTLNKTHAIRVGDWVGVAVEPEDGPNGESVKIGIVCTSCSALG